MNAAAAAGKALSAITVLRPSLSDSDPSENDPSIFAKLSRAINHPVACKVSDLAVRSSVGVHAAELQKTEPPINSASARIKIGVVSASLKEPLRLASVSKKYFEFKRVVAACPRWQCPRQRRRPRASRRWR